MSNNASIDALREQKNQELHIIEVSEALARLEKNKDYKLLSDFLFKDMVLRHSEFSFGLNYEDAYQGKSRKLLKALVRTNAYLKNLHAIADDATQHISEIDAEIVKLETED